MVITLITTKAQIFIKIQHSKLQILDHLFE